MKFILNEKYFAVILLFSCGVNAAKLPLRHDVINAQHVQSRSNLPKDMMGLYNKVMNILIEKDQRIFGSAYRFDNLLDTGELIKREILPFKLMSNFVIDSVTYDSQVGFFDKKMREITDDFNEKCQKIRDESVNKVSFLVQRKSLDTLGELEEVITTMNGKYIAFEK